MVLLVAYRTTVKYVQDMALDFVLVGKNELEGIWP